MGDQPGDGGAAGLVGVEHLAEEDPEGDQRGEDPVVPGRLDLAEGLLEAAGGQDVGEGEAAVLEELPAEEVDLTTKTSLRIVEHHSGSEPVREVPPSSEPERPLFPIPPAGNIL